MKAEVGQQRSLLELAELDQELVRISHQAGHLPQRQEYDRIQSDHHAAEDRLAALRIALEDLDAQVARLESEIDAVRQREDRDRSMLQAGTVQAKQVADLQHELETLERRQSSLEDSLLEVMERREELQGQQTAESAAVEALQSSLAAAQQALDVVLTEVEGTRGQRSARRDELAAGLDPGLLALYERKRSAGGAGAGPLHGRQCGACRIEIDRGELARISAAADDDVLSCPECGAILLRVKEFGR
ncbi:MAG TPA: zinc ribbon domain-containing protein [Mycobacterium sp.]|nr:zinc ribbon domain-containing protein [Mycobacterium sp.]